MKRKIIFLLLLLLIGFVLVGYCSPKTEEIVLNQEGYFGIYNTDSNFQEERIRFQNGDLLYGFLDTEGDIAIEAVYSECEPFSEGLGAVVKDGEVCYLDKQGKNVLKTGMYQNEIYFADDFFNQKFPLHFFRFSNDRAIYYDAEKSKWGYIDKQNKLVIDCQYDVVEPFDGGLAVVEKTGAVGVINTAGEIVVPFGQYQYCYNMGEGYVAVSRQYDTEKHQTGTLDILDSQGKCIKADIDGFIYADVSEDCFIVWPENEEHLEIYDVSGNIRFTMPVWEESGSGDIQYLIDMQKSHEGKMLVEYAGADYASRYGYVDSMTGKFVIEPQYEEAYRFSDGIAVVKKNDRYGAIDSEGNIVIPFEYGAERYIDISGEIYSQNGVVALQKEYCCLVKHDTKQPEEQKMKSTAAIPNNAMMLVDGKGVHLKAYNINGNNYFKLRDLAVILSGTDKQFSVQWDEEKRIISLKSNQSYQGKIAKDKTLEKSAVLNTAQLLKDNVVVTLDAYNISGNTYFKLRDIGQLFGFEVDWDAVNKTIRI